MMSPRHRPFYFAIPCGLIALLVVGWADAGYALEAAANVFFLAYLVMVARKLPHLRPALLRAHADDDDEPAWVIVVVALSATVIAMIALALLIAAGSHPEPFALALAMSSVALGWLTIHTMAALHYAHLYWSPAAAQDAPNDRTLEGLEFPGNEKPCGTDFLYFAFVIGMTAQTSDVAITSSAMRRVNLLHAVVSFLFNTLLIAAAVNAAVGLGK